MRTFIAAVIVPLLFMLALAGCSENENTGNPVNVPTHNNNNATDVGEDVSESDADPGTTPDTGEEPYAPGFMDGTWELRRSSSDALILTMTLMHKEGEEAVNGSFVIADDEGTSGLLNQGRWFDETFSIDWHLTIDGRQEQFTYNEARREDESDERLMGRYNDLYEGQIVDARLVRVNP